MNSGVKRKKIKNYIRRQEELGHSPSLVTLYKYGDRTTESVEAYRAYMREREREWRRNTTNPKYRIKENPTQNSSPADDGTTETGSLVRKKGRQSS